MEDVDLRGVQGTGNMEIHLDRRLMTAHLPTINIEQSGRARRSCCSRRTSLPEGLALRKALSQLNPVEGMELLLDQLKLTKSTRSSRLDAFDGVDHSEGGVAPLRRSSRA